MFKRRSPQAPQAPATDTPVAAAPPTRVAVDPAQSKKGHPTRSRREAEAEAKKRAKTAANPKSARKQDRNARMERSREIRQKIKEGDERYLSRRDRGPMRRFVRDFIDRRLTMLELAMPALIGSLAMQLFGLLAVGNALVNATILMVVIDSLFVRFTLRRELKRRFPDESYRGLTFYAIMRGLQMRFMRLPKPQMRIGSPQPTYYR